MMRQAVAYLPSRRRRPVRAGLVSFVLLLFLVTLFSLLALTVDVGLLCCHQAKLESAAEAAALAGTAELMDTAILYGASGRAGPPVAPVPYGSSGERIAQAKSQAGRLAAQFGVRLYTAPAVAEQRATTPEAAEDVVAGWVEDPTAAVARLDRAAADGSVNSLWVRATRSYRSANPITLWLGRLLGLRAVEMGATGRATVDQRIYGFRPAGHLNVPMVPLVLIVGPEAASTHDSSSAAAPLLEPSQDEFTVDQRTGRVTAGPDGIPEVVVQVGHGDGAVGADNAEGRTTVEVFTPGGGPFDPLALGRQTLFGLTRADLSPLGGQIALGPDGGPRVFLRELPAAGALRQALVGILGEKRIWPAGVIEGTACRLVGFTATCVVDCRQAADSALSIVLQPCLLQTPTALTGAGVPRNGWIGKLMLSQ